MPKVQVRAGDIVAQLGGELLGDATLVLTNIAALSQAGADSICFVADPRYAEQLPYSAAGCVIVPEGLREAVASRAAAIVCADPYLYYARLTQWWLARTRTRATAGVHASAVVELGTMVHATAAIGALAYIGAGARVGPHVVVGSHCHVGAGAVVGEGTTLMPRVTLGEDCRVGARCRAHSGAVIGADGFGFAPHQGAWERIEQFGAVVIGDDVEIGANTCVDRGTLEDTLIGDGVKLDNLIQIGHNVRIGAHSALAGCVGVAGSTHIGARCTFGGQVGIVGHLTIVDDVHVGGGTVVARSILRPGHYGGVFPMDENGVWEKNAAVLRQLHALRARLRALENKHT